MIRRGAAAVAAIMAVPGAGGADQVTDWLIATGAEPRALHEIALFTPDTPQILGADPLTFGPDYPFDFLAVPPGPARVVALREPTDGRVALAAMIFADGAPSCGAEDGAIWVDSGTAAFLTPATAARLDALARDYDQREKNLYDDYFAAPDQMGDSVFARMLTLPDGTAFPGFASGWGDGAYPVIRLYDAEGRMLALYADFIGSDVLDGYILPPPCPAPTS